MVLHVGGKTDHNIDRQLRCDTCVAIVAPDAFGVAGGLRVDGERMDRVLLRSIRASMLMAAGSAERAISETSTSYDVILERLLQHVRDAADRLLPLSMELGQPVMRQSLVTPAEITEAIRASVVKYSQLPWSDICRHRRIRPFVIPRHVAMWAMRKFTPMTTVEIGDEFGGRDHSTVCHALQVVERELRDGGPRAALAELVRAEVTAMLSQQEVVTT